MMTRAPLMCWGASAPSKAMEVLSIKIIDDAAYDGGLDEHLVEVNDSNISFEQFFEHHCNNPDTFNSPDLMRRGFHKCILIGKKKISGDNKLTAQRKLTLAAAFNYFQSVESIYYHLNPATSIEVNIIAPSDQISCDYDSYESITPLSITDNESRLPHQVSDIVNAQMNCGMKPRVTKDIFGESSELDSSHSLLSLSTTDTVAIAQSTQDGSCIKTMELRKSKKMTAKMENFVTMHALTREHSGNQDRSLTSRKRPSASVDGETAEPIVSSSSSSSSSTPTDFARSHSTIKMIFRNVPVDAPGSCKPCTCGMAIAAMVARDSPVLLVAMNSYRAQLSGIDMFDAITGQPKGSFVKTGVMRPYCLSMCGDELLVSVHAGRDGAAGGCVKVYNFHSKELLATIGENELKWPQGLAVMPKKRQDTQTLVFVANTLDDDIVVYQRNAHNVPVTRITVTDTCRFRPTFLRICEERAELFASDPDNAIVRVFNAQLPCKLKRSIGMREPASSTGTGNEHVFKPIGLSTRMTDDNNLQLFVVDDHKNCVHLFDGDTGVYMRRLAYRQGLSLSRPYDLQWLWDKKQMLRLYVSEYTQNRVQTFNVNI